MKHPEFTCSTCGSVNLRRSHSQSFADIPKMAMGIYPFRCLNCRARFWINIWLFSKKTCAVCPHCLAMEVAPASLEGKRLSLLQKILLRMGARGYRCGSCNRRFLTFNRARPRAAKTPVDRSHQTETAEAVSAASAGK
jgi:DNA-directed RNA polymerase subunit RPC12/RpoP